MRLDSRVEKPVSDKQEVVEADFTLNQLMEVMRMTSIQWKNLNS